MAELNVIAVEPFYGGSHRRFLDAVSQRSRHRWKLVTGKGVHWKWRMRSAPLQLADATAELLRDGFRPDVVFCTDMLDLPQWRGLLRDPDLLTAPTAIYFHENQWTYPVAPLARVDHHYGYTNLLSALAADAVIFNSAFHRDEFMSASGQFVSRMPDATESHDIDRIGRIAKVIAPGFVPPDRLASRSTNESLTIGWVARWEHDKRPDQFETLLDRLTGRGLEFELILLGPRPRNGSEPLDHIRQRYADRIRFDGFAETREDYWQRLSEMDVVVSTADHEFFGIAICEAIWAGAIPVLPNRLSYPELAAPECLYDNLDEAVRRIESAQDTQSRSQRQTMCREKIEAFQIEHTVRQIDELISELNDS